jgi:hypothetical protein
VRLAIEGGCNAVASTFGVLGAVARKYAHRIPFIVKINHNELLTYPNKAEQVMFGTVRDAWNMGAVAVGATVYFGSADATRELVEVAAAFEEAHSLGLATILWCYMRNSQFNVNGVNYETSADLSSQANHLGVTIQADIVKQKLPTNNGGFKALNTGGPDALSGGQRLHGAHWPDQLWRRQRGRQRPGRCHQDCRGEQARRRHRPDQRPQGLPAPDARRRCPAARDSGCVSERGRDHRLTHLPWPASQGARSLRVRRTSITGSACVLWWSCL